MAYNRAIRGGPTITAVRESGEWGTPIYGGVGEEYSDWESAAYSSPYDLFRYLPEDQLDDEMRQWIKADDAIKEEKNRVLGWLGGLS